MFFQLADQTSLAMSIDACHHRPITVCLTACLASCIHTLTSDYARTIPSGIHPQQRPRSPPLILCCLYLTAARSDHTLTMIYAGQQPFGVGTELATAQSPGAGVPNASRQSSAQRVVKCRFFTSRKGR